MSETNRDDQEESVGPGPAAYNVEYAMKKVRPTAPSYSMTPCQRERTAHTHECTPGPGSYGTSGNFHDKRQAPHYSFGERHSWLQARVVVEDKD